jgi:hypothetical protein
VPRSTYYYQPRPESTENLRLLRQLDQLYLKRPFFGSRKMAVELKVNRKRIQRLMRILGIEALYPKPNLSRPAPGHQVYPYLLRGVAIERPNHVWSTENTSRLVPGMAASRCRENVAWLWRRRASTGVTGVGTGWGLSDGVWHEHTWGMDDAGIVETTKIQDHYYGVVFGGERAEGFLKSHRLIY